MESSGAEFLNRSFPDLQKSPQVQRAVEHKFDSEKQKTPNNPRDRLEVYLERLESVFENPAKKKRMESIRIFKNKFLYPMVLINENDIPESYFNLQKRIAEEKGLGSTSISKQMRHEAGVLIHREQKESLDTWLNYLGGNDSGLPSWFKYYVISNVIRMSPYNKTRAEFGKRSSDTVAVFPELNREALSYTYDTLVKYYKIEDKLVDRKKGIKKYKTGIDYIENDSNLDQILKAGSFPKIYGYHLRTLELANKERGEGVEGEWVKFNKGNNPTALSESIRGHNTGWCTAGTETARTQLRQGDFYVFYSKDKQGRNTIPRIAIRMEGDFIAEVRGVGTNQNLEENLIDIAREKYLTLPGGERFEKKSYDMNLVTQINKKVESNQDLTEDEVIFIFEFKDKIIGFGFERDPRIEKIKRRLDELDCFNKLTDAESKKKAAEYLVSKLNTNTPISQKDKNVFEYLLKNSESASIIAQKIDLFIDKGAFDEMWPYLYKHKDSQIAEYLIGSRAVIFTKDYFSSSRLIPPEKKVVFDKLWKLINEVGDSKVATALVSNVDNFHESADDIASNLFNFLREKGDGKTAEVLVEKVIKRGGLEMEIPISTSSFYESDLYYESEEQRKIESYNNFWYKHGTDLLGFVLSKRSDKLTSLLQDNYEFFDVDHTDYSKRIIDYVFENSSKDSIVNWLKRLYSSKTGLKSEYLIDKFSKYIQSNQLEFENREVRRFKKNLEKSKRRLEKKNYKV